MLLAAPPQGNFANAAISLGTPRLAAVVTGPCPVAANRPILGVVALTGLIVSPFWSALATHRPLTASSHPPLSAHATTVAPIPPDALAQAQLAARPAHLNLDVRHSFGNVALSVAVDGKTIFDAPLTGSGKKFKVFGKRPERGFTKTLELEPGVRVVRVRVTSPADKYDQSRTERFELDSASVATMQISADKAGLSIVVQRPTTVAAPREPVTPGAPAPVATAALASAAVPVTASNVAASDASLELLQTMRSMLIAIMGFVASAATGFVVQEFMRSRRGLLFDRRRKNRRREAASA